jgi:geranylgeranyl diphosphate synthase type I
MTDTYRNSRTHIADAIEQTLASYTKQFATTHPWALDAVPRLARFAASGKMVRGYILMLAAQPKTDAERADALKVAVAIELLHAGVLIHDDIMDQDELRRGKPSVYAQYAHEVSLAGSVHARRYGESLATCVGIVAYFIGMELLAQVADAETSRKLSLLVARELALLGLAQMQDVASAARMPEHASDVRTLYEQKTGRYTFSLPLMAGALLAQQPLESQAAEIGYEFGVAFQLQDDLLNLIGDPDVTGKSAGSDIREAKWTLPALDLFEHLSEAARAELLELYDGVPSDEDVARIIELMRTNGVLERAQQEVVSRYARVAELVPHLPLRPEATEELSRFVSALAARVS